MSLSGLLSLWRVVQRQRQFHPPPCLCRFCASPRNLSRRSRSNDKLELLGKFPCSALYCFVLPCCCRDAGVRPEHVRGIIPGGGERLPTVLRCGCPRHPRSRHRPRRRLPVTCPFVLPPLYANRSQTCPISINLPHLLLPPSVSRTSVSRLTSCGRWQTRGTCIQRPSKPKRFPWCCRGGM